VAQIWLRSTRYRVFFQLVSIALFSLRCCRSLRVIVCIEYSVCCLRPFFSFSPPPAIFFFFSFFPRIIRRVVVEARVLQASRSGELLGRCASLAKVEPRLLAGWWRCFAVVGTLSYHSMTTTKRGFHFSPASFPPSQVGAGGGCLSGNGISLLLRHIIGNN